MWEKALYFACTALPLFTLCLKPEPSLLWLVSWADLFWLVNHLEMSRPLAYHIKRVWALANRSVSVKQWRHYDIEVNRGVQWRRLVVSRFGHIFLVFYLNVKLKTHIGGFKDTEISPFSNRVNIVSPVTDLCWSVPEQDKYDVPGSGRLLCFYGCWKDELSHGGSMNYQKENPSKRKVEHSANVLSVQ